MKTYNPKSHAPAVYIPVWLIQVPVNELSIQAKMVYGRLAQWSNSKNIVHRTLKQLAEELGVGHGVIKRSLRELRECKLIETYQACQGGENYYRFLDHPWIHAELLDVFDSYKSQDNKDHLETKTIPYPRVKNDHNPGSKMTLPRVKNDLPKVKEIKESSSLHRESKVNIPTVFHRESVENQFCAKKRRNPATEIPEDFCTNEKHAQLACELNLGLHVELNLFIDYYTAHGKRMVNWGAAFSNWLRRSAQYKQERSRRVSKTVASHPVTSSFGDLQSRIQSGEISEETFRSIF